MENQKKQMEVGVGMVAAIVLYPYKLKSFSLQSNNTVND